MGYRLYAGALCLLFLSACADKNPPVTGMDLTSLSLVELRDRIQSGETTSVQVVEALIRKVEASPELNVFISFDAQRARQAAQLADRRKTGRLRGVPLVVKDNIEVAGMVHTAGTPGLLGYRPGRNATVVDALVAEGAIILGKTNMHELAFGITSNNSHFGAVGNPHRPDFFAGGSSGGTAAAIAAQMAPAGLGTDTGGSARIPAALTGIQGYRPTTGRYSAEGITPISSTRDTAGIMAKSVADIVLLDAVITGKQADFTAETPQRIRLGVPQNYFYDNLQPGVSRVIRQALGKLENAGVRLVPVAISDDLAKLNGAVGFPLVLHEAQPVLDTYLRGRTGGYIDYASLIAAIASPDVATIFSQAVGTISHEDYRQALTVARPALQHLYAGLFRSQQIEGLIFPTTPLTARPIAGSDQEVVLNAKKVNTFLTYIRNTDPSSNAGIPSVSIHAGTTDGLPVGIQIDAPAGDDLRLFAIALTIERILAH